MRDCLSYRNKSSGRKKNVPKGHSLKMLQKKKKKQNKKKQTFLWILSDKKEFLTSSHLCMNFQSIMDAKKMFVQ